MSLEASSHPGEPTAPAKPLKSGEALSRGSSQATPELLTQRNCEIIMCVVWSHEVYGNIITSQLKMNTCSVEGIQKLRHIFGSRRCRRNDKIGIPTLILLMLGMKVKVSQAPAPGEQPWPFWTRILLFSLYGSADMAAVSACVKGSFAEDSWLRACMWCLYSKNNVGSQDLRI